MQVFAILLTLFTYSYAAGDSKIQSWKVYDNVTKIPCIIFYGQIDLALNYYAGSTESEKAGIVHVPYSSTVDQSQSSCSKTLPVNGSSVPVESQIIHIKMDHMPGWAIRFYFSTDNRLETANGRQWALYRTDVYANYSNMPDQFIQPDEPTHNYISAVNVNTDTMISDYIYADKTHAYACPSGQKYLMNDDISNGPRWTMTLTYLQVQAYATQTYSGIVPVGQKEICPTDQHVTDKVPIIVGCSLAGLIVLVTVLYLIYRACLPKEVITLVNPASHFENRAMTLEDEESAIESTKSSASLHL